MVSGGHLEGVWIVSKGCPKGVWGVYVCLCMSGGCVGGVWGVLGVIKTYRLTKFKIAVEGVLKVSEGCLKGCLEGVWGVWWMSGGV